MKRSTESMLTTHAGSLPRPDSLRDILADRQVGRDYDADRLEAEVRAAIDAVVAKQAEVGLTVVNDGENSKYSFITYLKDRLDGFGVVEEEISAYYASRRGLGPGEIRASLDFPEFFEGRGSADSFVREGKTAERAVCTGPISWKDFSEVERDIANLKSALAPFDGQVADAFMSATSPGAVLMTLPNRYYKDDEEYLYAIADAMSREYKAIVDAGFVLQLDCPDLATRVIAREQAALERGERTDFSLEEFRREIKRNIDVLNHATRDIDPDQMRIHVCWGSTEYPHHLDTELKDFVDVLLTARPAGLMVVGANGRHEHEWRVWEDVTLPEGKVVLPGVIDSTTNIIEHPDTVAERILRYASVLGKENVIANVDCGFQTSAGRDQVDPRVAWAKLRSLSEGAARASRELWGSVTSFAVGG
ncbi:MAG TPA: cobalamin-independent methionine synthase II family protein [Solirubrobacteraceae bacterium]|nr:cobalamin-independent methionine synthase II family protein [Solirubrobacteraceae bacterium]